MNSNQEKLINLFASLTFGSPLIFDPDEYKKGNSTREPADLVLVANNTIILFYMKSKEKIYSKHKSVIQSRRQKLINDNIKQARGWMNEWESRNLTGKNDFTSFSIKKRDFKNIIIIGLVDYTLDFCVSHKKVSNELNAKYCVTISQDIIEQIFKMNFSMLDLILIIDYIERNCDENSIFPLENIITKYYDLALQKVFKEKISENFFKEANLLLDSLKSQYNLNNKSGHSIVASELFCDLELIETLKMKYQIAKILTEMKNEKEYRICVIPLKKLKIVISLSAWQNWPIIIDKFNITMDTYNDGNGTLGMIYEFYTKSSIFIPIHRTCKSSLEEFLENKNCL